MIQGFLINKFRGDVSLFDDGYAAIESRTGWRGFGVLPFFPEATRLPAEDALDLTSGASPGGVKIVALALSRLANFDDLDPLRLEPGVDFHMIGPGQVLPGDAALVILPGSKSTRGDLEFLRRQGWDVDLKAHWRRGGRILGICGGYQMLGRKVSDPEGLEGAPGESEGLGFLEVETVLDPVKRLSRVTARHLASGAETSGYEIHLGRTTGPDLARPFAMVGEAPEGAISADGRVAGLYLHGIFGGDAFRAAFLKELGASSSRRHGAEVEATLDALADHMEAHLDVEGLLTLAKSGRAAPA